MIENPKAKRAQEYFLAIRAKCHELIGVTKEVAMEHGVTEKEYARAEEIDTLAREGMEEME